MGPAINILSPTMLLRPSAAAVTGVVVRGRAMCATGPIIPAEPSFWLIATRSCVD